jgi:hypothetical protein
MQQFTKTHLAKKTGNYHAEATVVKVFLTPISCRTAMNIMIHGYPISCNAL